MQQRQLSPETEPYLASRQALALEYSNRFLSAWTPLVCSFLLVFAYLLFTLLKCCHKAVKLKPQSPSIFCSHQKREASSACWLAFVYTCRFSAWSMVTFVTARMIEGWPPFCLLSPLIRVSASTVHSYDRCLYRTFYHRMFCSWFLSEERYSIVERLLPMK